MPPRLPYSCLLALLLAGGCAHGPGPDQTIPQLAAMLDAPVESAEQNQRNSVLVNQIADAKHLHGFTRAELADRIGQGEPCSRHPLCRERGFGADDWYYEVGREGRSYVRHRPALILGFNRYGKVERTFVLRAPE